MALLNTLFMIHKQRHKKILEDYAIIQMLSDWLLALSEKWFKGGQPPFYVVRKQPNNPRKILPHPLAKINRQIAQSFAVFNIPILCNLPIEIAFIILYNEYRNKRKGLNKNDIMRNDYCNRYRYCRRIYCYCNYWNSNIKKFKKGGWQPQPPNV